MYYNTLALYNNHFFKAKIKGLVEIFLKVEYILVQKYLITRPSQIRETGVTAYYHLVLGFLKTHCALGMPRAMETVREYGIR